MRFQCACGKFFEVDAASAGAEVRCPECGKMFPVPGAAKPPEPSKPGPEKACPGCGKPLVAKAVICIACGYDLRTGKKLGAANEPPRPIPPPSPEPAGAKTSTYLYAGVLAAVIIVGVVYALRPSSEPPPPPKVEPVARPEAPPKMSPPLRTDNTTVPPVSTPPKK